MIDVNTLDNLFLEYGYALREENQSCRVYVLLQGMYYGAEIVIFDDSDQSELYDEYSKVGFSVKLQHFQTIEEVEEYLFQGFFKTEVSQMEIRRRYQDFAEKQIRPYGQNEDVKYEYIQVPFTVYRNSCDDGMKGNNLIDTIFEQIEAPGAHLVIVEAAAGYGKTCTSYEIFKTFLIRKPKKSIKPIFTELSRNRDAKKFKYVLWSEIDSEKSTLAKQSLVIYNITKGRIPLIIDGFDELLSKDIDSGSQEGLDEFEQVETMLSTIGGLLKGDAKVILTSRKTAIFAGSQFEEWVESYNGAFDVNRFQLEKPEIGDWLTNEREKALLHANVPLAQVSNPVLLTYLRNISDEAFDDVLNNPEDITAKYFDFLLNREKIRQNIIIKAEDQQIIYENLALSFAEFDILGEGRQFIKELIVEYNKAMLLQYKELSPNNPTLSELADTLTNHALLDRMGNKDYVTFVNEYIFGYLLGKALINNTCAFLKKQTPYPDGIIERAISSFRYAKTGDKEKLWNRLCPYKNRMNLHSAIMLDCILLHRVKSSYDSCGITSLEFDHVCFDMNDGVFSNVSFVDCMFNSCEFDQGAFVSDVFTGCSFKNCVLKNIKVPNVEEKLHFYGCEDFNSGLIDKFNNASQSMSFQCADTSVELQILDKYFKVDGRSTKMKYISYIKNEFPSDKLDDIFLIFESLRKRNLIIVKGNNSFITKAGINYFHKHS